MNLNRRQFLQGSILVGLFTWLKLKFPQLSMADDGSTPLPACLPFCLTSGNPLVGSGSSLVQNRATILRRETENGAVINISRRGLFTGRLDR